MTHAQVSNITQPVYRLEPWQADAACNDADPTLFHYDHNERGHHRRARERQAKAICATCPVISACANYAERAGDRHGIYGGMTPSDRGWDDQGRQRTLRKHVSA